MSVYAYVVNLNDDSISQIDTGTNTVAATWTGLSGINYPFAAALSPDGSLLMVVDLIGAAVVFIDTATATTITTTSLGGTGNGCWLSADGSLLGVALNGGNLAVLDTSTYAVINTATISGSPTACVITPDNSTAYVVEDPGTDVFVVDLSTYTVTDTFSVDTSSGLAITADGSTIIMAGRGTSTIFKIDTGTNSVTGSVGTTGGGVPLGVAISADGSTAYVVNNTDGLVEVVDIASMSITTTVAVGSGPTEVAISVDGTQAYVSDTSGDTVTPIDLGTNTAGSPISVGHTPYGVATSYPTSSTPVYLDGTADIVYDGSGDMTIVPSTFDGTGHIVYDGSADLTISPPVFLDGTGDIEYSGSAELTISPTIDLDGTGAIEYDGTADLTIMSLPAKTVTTLVLAGDPGPSGFGCVLVPTPPNPQPGLTGNHDYEVVICDKYGVAFGVIPTAVPTQIDYDLDDIGQCLIDFAIEDILAQILLPISVFPGVREVQVWRDQCLIWWGWPISATFDASQVHLTCQGFLWALNTREIGPERLHYVTNPQFESGLADWTAVNCFAVPVNNPVALGQGAARLEQFTTQADAYLEQIVEVDLTDSPTGIAFALSAYVYLDGNYAFNGPALDSRGLYMEDQDGNFSFVSIDTGFTPNTWTRLEVQPSSPDPPAPAFIAPAGVVTTYQLRLYCPNGSVVWDDVVLKAYENVSSPPASPPATAWDVTDIIQALLESAQDPSWGKNDLSFQFYGAPTGQLLNRVYQVPDSEVVLDAINEFPTIGICDFEMVWDATGHFRGLQVFSPSKGQIQWNWPINVEFNQTTDLNGQLDGSQVGTTQRIFGQGSSGPSRDAGYASFASYLGGRTASDGGFESGTDIVASIDIGFTADDVGVNLYSLGGALHPQTYITEIIDPTHARLNTSALLTLAGDTIGIGGIVVDQSQSALPNQPVSTLQGSAQAYLTQQMRPQALLSSKMRADGPNGMFGRITVGDVVPVSADYGWLQIDPPVLLRTSKITLYPPTEEMEVTLMPVGAPVTL